MVRLKWVILGIVLLAAVSLQQVCAANIQHTVQRGDTLYHIAKQYGVSVGVLLRVNDISNARSLKVGMRLEIPDTYRVRKGDTLYSIARSRGISLDRLLAVNHIHRNYLIKVGEVLVLPQGGSPRPKVASNKGDSATIVEQTQSAPATQAPEGKGSGQTVATTLVGVPFWPAPGDRVFLTGKLAGGTQISGNVGDPVYAVAGGRVVWVGPYRGYGRVVFVESPNRYIYVYGGNETTLVRVGDRVTPGTELANMGINPHLGRARAYFFVYKNGRPVDPKTAPRG